RRRHHRGVAGHADPARRPRGGENQSRRSAAAGIETPDREIARTAILEREPARSHAGSRRGAVDRAHRLGKPVGFSLLPLREKVARTKSVTDQGSPSADPPPLPPSPPPSSPPPPPPGGR